MMHDPDLPAWKPKPDPSPFPWILATFTTLAWMLTAIRAMEMRRHLDAAMDAKMATEQELLRERQRPGLTPWEPVEVTWYGGSFHGRLTSDGSRFHAGLPTCASPSLPPGTIVVARGLQGQLVPMIVTDHLPEPERLDRLDVSEISARRLGILKTGRATLQVAAVRVGGIP